MQSVKIEANNNLVKRKHNSNNHIEKASLKAWLILACGWAFYLYEYALRVSPGAMQDSLMEAFKITATSLGVMSSTYYLAYVPLQMICGVLVDKLGPRLIVTVSCVLCTIGAFLFAVSENLWLANSARFLIGAGSACAYLSCAKIGAEWFPPNKFSIVAGLTMMMGTVGGICGTQLLTIPVNILGWRHSMLWSAAIGGVLTFVCWLFIKERSENASHHQPKLTSKELDGSFFDGLKIILKKPQNWLIGLYGCMMYLPISAFAELWGIPFIMAKYNVDNIVASQSSTMVFVGMALGSVGGAWISEKIGSRKKVMSMAAIGTLIFFAAAVYLPNIPLNIMMIMLLVGGFFNGGQIVYFVAAKESNPVGISATAVGFTNCVLMASGPIFQTLLGNLLDLVWDGKYKANGVPLYDIKHYEFALSAMIIALLAGWVISRMIEETFDPEDALPASS